MNTTTITVFYGKGEYAITSANVDRLIRHAQDYIEKSIWKWSIQDNLGFQKKGVKTKRYDEIVAQLAQVDEPQIQILRELMLRLEPKPQEELKCRVKQSPELKEAKRAELRAQLEDIGVDAVTMERMLKAV